MGRHWVSAGLFLAVFIWVVMYLRRPEAHSQVTQSSGESRLVQAEATAPQTAPAIVYETVVPVEPADVITTLVEARANRQRIILEWADSAAYRDPQTGAFSLSRYQARLAQFQGIDLTPFVLDGTLAGLLVVDEPHNPARWGGAPVPLFDLEVAAVKSKAFFPAVPVGVGAPPTFLEAGAPWTGLDFALLPYPAAEVNLNNWLAQEAEAADRAKLAFGLFARPSSSQSSNQR
ncbi:MAG: hypothetical protein AB1791_13970 [Chloroflexota bacterium]